MVDLLRKATESRVTPERPYVAVASMEGLFVNQHLGEAHSLWIYQLKDGSSYLVESRLTPPAGLGIERWERIADLLHDCNTVLVSGIGRNPQMVLERSGIRVVAMEGFIAEGVEAVLNGKEIPKIMLNTPGKCGAGKSCTGTGGGCG
jgi:nitrogen fixation protein NifB